MNCQKCEKLKQEAEQWRFGFFLMFGLIVVWSILFNGFL